MRETKFRGRNITTGEWVYGCLLNNLWTYSELHPLHGSQVCEIIIPGEATDWEAVEDLKIEVDPKTVGQFTGLKDKNGKDIYEGDVLAPMSPSIGPMNIIFEDGCFVAYNKYGRWGWLYRLTEPTFTEVYSIEVIGNIYQHPELLTPAK